MKMTTKFFKLNVSSVSKLNIIFFKEGRKFENEYAECLEDKNIFLCKFFFLFCLFIRYTVKLKHTRHFRCDFFNKSV